MSVFHTSSYSNNLFQRGKILFLLLILSCTLFAQTSETIKTTPISLTEVEVSGRRTPTINSNLGRVVTVISREEIAKLPVTSVADLLQYSMNVDVRQRGPVGIQADLSFRGGSFDQVMILLNGVNITDPQTGHHNLNLPLDLQSIERVEVLEGAGARTFGPNAFTGAINFITATKEQNNVSANASYGMYGLHSEGANITLKTAQITHFAAGSHGESGGYMANSDFKTSNGFYHGIALVGNEKLELQLGFNEKSYGANSFYSAAYPNQFEHTRTYFGSLKLSGGDKLKYNTAIYQRRNIDHFELIRESPLFRNYHLTDVTGINANAYFNWIGGKTSFGGDLKNEAIWSNTLGYLMNDTLSIPGEEGGKFTKKYARANAAAFLEHSYTYNNLSLSAGLLANWNSGLDWKFRYYPGIDANYKITANFSVFGNINSALRMPTFTDMFNASGGRIGSDKLKPETSWNYEIGIKQHAKYGNGSVVFYLRDGKNMIDWGQYPSDGTKFYARNIADIIARGVEVNYKLNATSLLGPKQPLRSVNLAYGYNDQNIKQIPNYISLYALDYLKHKLTIGFNHQIFSSLEATWTFILEERKGSYQIDKTKAPINYPAFGLLNGRIAWARPKYKIYCEASNIFDRKYIDIAGVDQPGLWVKIGTNINLNF